MVHAAEGTLQAYLDGEIDGAAERALCDHVASCAVCTAELETLRSAGGLVHQSLGLLDSPAPTLQARPAMARERRGTGRRRMARLGAWGLAKAAMLMLVLAGAGAAAIPDVRRALETTFSRVVALFGGQERTAAAPAQPEPLGEPEVIVPGESFVTPADGRVEIVLQEPAGEVEVIVRLIDEPQAHIETATTGTVARRVGTGRLELSGLGAGTVTIGIPRATRAARIEVDGVVRVYKEDGSLHGSDGAARGSEVRFIAGS